MKKEHTETDFKGNKIWRAKNGKLHRIDGPAIERINGDREWYINNKLHRLDGPALEYAYKNNVNNACIWYESWFVNFVKINDVDYFLLALISKENN